MGVSAITSLKGEGVDKKGGGGVTFDTVGLVGFFETVQEIEIHLFRSF